MELNYAGVDKRIGAGALDYFISIVLAYMSVLVASFILAFIGALFIGNDPVIVDIATLFGFIIGFCTYNIYFIIPEAKWGQTVGKHALGIKVVKSSDGSDIGFLSAFGRQLTRIFGTGMLSAITAILLISISDEEKRLGDHIASTTVIKTDEKDETDEETSPNSDSGFNPSELDDSVNSSHGSGQDKLDKTIEDIQEQADSMEDEESRWD